MLFPIKRRSDQHKSIRLVTGINENFTAIHIQKRINERGDIYTNCGRWIDRKIISVKNEAQQFDYKSLVDKSEITKRELRLMLGCDCYACMRVQIKRTGVKVIDTPIVIPERKKRKEQA